METEILTWRVEEKISGPEICLTVFCNDVFQGLFDITMYHSGPCIKWIILTSKANSFALKAVVEHLKEKYHLTGEIYAYTYPHKIGEQKLLRKAGFHFFKHCDARRVMFRLSTETENVLMRTVKNIIGTFRSVSGF